MSIIKIQQISKRYRSVQIRWDDPDVYKAFLAMKTADSVTVDPHKMGYVPYPAGIVAFKNRLVTEFTRQRAQYISDVRELVERLDERTPIADIGPYILEGSKPGSAAASCWLAHTTIPLTVDGHGAIVRASLLSAKKLTRYLHFHKHLFAEMDREFASDALPCRPFTFRTLFEPDTNVVCFVVVPTEIRGGAMMPVPTELSTLNDVNRSLYGRLSIQSTQLKGHLPYVQPFYVSRTRIESDQYSTESVRHILDWLAVAPEDYERHGLFVLRSTVMNPLYGEAERQGYDYLYKFVGYLHAQARIVLAEVYGPPMVSAHPDDLPSGTPAREGRSRRLGREPNQ